MTAFFIPGLETDVPAAERLYDDLRTDAQARSGGVAHKRRIFGIACRRRGADCTIQVGDSRATEGRIVIAILQVGRDGFTIHTRDPEDPSDEGTIEISRRTVYSVTDFD